MRDIIGQKYEIFPDWWGFRRTNWTAIPCHNWKQYDLVIGPLGILYLILVKRAVIRSKIDDRNNFTGLEAGLDVRKKPFVATWY